MGAGGFYCTGSFCKWFGLCSVTHCFIQLSGSSPPEEKLMIHKIVKKVKFLFSG